MSDSSSIQPLLSKVSSKSSSPNGSGEKRVVEAIGGAFVNAFSVQEERQEAHHNELLERFRGFRQDLQESQLRQENRQEQFLHELARRQEESDRRQEERAQQNAELLQQNAQIIQQNAQIVQQNAQIVQQNASILFLLKGHIQPPANN